MCATLGGVPYYASAPYLFVMSSQYQQCGTVLLQYLEGITKNTC